MRYDARMEQQQTPLSPIAKFCKLAELGRIDVRTNTVIRFGDTETTVETHILSAVLNEHVEMRRIVVDTLRRPGSHMEPDPFGLTNFKAAVEVNRELSRKLAAAEAEKNLAEMTLNTQTENLRVATCQRDAAQQQARDWKLMAVDAEKAREKAIKACADHMSQQAGLAHNEKLKRQRDQARKLLLSIAEKIEQMRLGDIDLWPADLFTRKAE